MRVARVGLLAGSVVTLLGVTGGCQNKVYEENMKLREQNRELQTRVDERGATTPSPGPAIAEPMKLPDTQPVVRGPITNYVQTPPPAPVPVPVTPPDNGLGGLDTTSDPVAGTTTVNFVGDALFDPGRATIKDTARAGLDKVAAALKKQYAGKPVRVQGHTDSDPIKHSTWASNQALSQARADAVRKYLVGKGVESARVTAEGFGDTKPKDTGTTTAAKAKNRRVEIVVVTR